MAAAAIDAPLRECVPGRRRRRRQQRRVGRGDGQRAKCIMKCSYGVIGSSDASWDRRGVRLSLFLDGVESGGVMSLGGAVLRRSAMVLCWTAPGERSILAVGTDMIWNKGGSPDSGPEPSICATASGRVPPCPSDTEETR